MNLRDLSQIATVRDLENLQEKIINEVRDLLYKKQKLEREFFTPKEFSHITGLKYSTVVYHCKVGRLKARQDKHGCSWQIDTSELHRFKNEANTL